MPHVSPGQSHLPLIHSVPHCLLSVLVSFTFSFFPFFTRFIYFLVQWHLFVPLPLDDVNEGIMFSGCSVGAFVR